MYNIDQVKRIVKENVEALSPLYKGMKFVDRVINEAEESGKVKNYIRENYGNAKGLYDFMYECCCGSKYNEIAEYIDYPLEEELLSEKYQTYFETLSGALGELESALAQKGYRLKDSDDFFRFGEGGISYGNTKRQSFEVVNDTKGLENLVHVQIYRMDSGKYELNYYYDGGGKKIKSITEDIGGEDITFTFYVKQWMDDDRVNFRYAVLHRFKSSGLKEIMNDRSKIVAILSEYEAAVDNMHNIDRGFIYIEDSSTDAIYSFPATSIPQKRWNELKVVKTGHPDKAELVEEEPTLDLNIEKVPRIWGYNEGSEFKMKHFDESYDEGQIKEIVETLAEMNPVAFMNESEMEHYLESNWGKFNEGINYKKVAAGKYFIVKSPAGYTLLNKDGNHIMIQPNLAALKRQSKSLNGYDDISKVKIEDFS